MTEEQMELARRLVACEQFNWLPGMKWTASNGAVGRIGTFRERPDTYEPGQGPDFTDYATAAILLRMAMEAGRIAAQRNGDEVWTLGRTGLRDWGDLFGADCWPAGDLGTVAATALLACWTPNPTPAPTSKPSSAPTCTPTRPAR